MISLKTSIGIELRGEDLLISSLQSNFSSGVFTHFKRIPNYRLREKEDLQQEIHLFFKSNRLSKDNIVLGIPRRDFVLRYLDLPAEVADNLKQVVQYQVQSFEPTEEDRFYYDYTLLRGDTPPKRLAVLLVMVRKTLLDEHLHLLHDLGIRPIIVLGSSMGLSNIFLHNRKDRQDKTFILADLSASTLELFALHRGAYVYSRESVKENDRSWKDIILQEADEATSKMRLGTEGALEKIILTGESSKSAYEEIITQIPDCELLTNHIPFTIPGENKAHLPEAASSLGLAFTGIVRRPSIAMNLLPPGLRIRQTRWAYVPAAICGLAIVALLITLGVHSMFQNRRLIDKLDREIQSLKPSVARVQSLRDQANTLETKIKSTENLLRKRDMNLEVLQELTKILPDDTFLNTYRYNDGTINLNGLSGSSSDIIPTLEKSPLLKDVVQRGSIYKNPQMGKDQFTLEAKLEK